MQTIINKISLTRNTQYFNILKRLRKILFEEIKNIYKKELNLILKKY